MNSEVLHFQGIKIEKREVYAVDYVDEILENYIRATNLDVSRFVSGIGHRKSIQQRQYQEMWEYAKRLKTYRNMWGL